MPVAWQSVSVIQLSPTFRGSSLVLCQFLPYLARIGELPLTQVHCFSGYPHHALDLFAHILTPPPTLQLEFGSSEQCCTVVLCLCFRQLMNEGSMVTFKIVINLATGQSQFIHLSTIAQGHPCGSQELLQCQVSCQPHSGSLNQDTCFLALLPCPAPILIIPFP